MRPVRVRTRVPCLCLRFRSFAFRVFRSTPAILLGRWGFRSSTPPDEKEAGDDADEKSPRDDHCVLAGAGRSVDAKPVELATATKRDSVVRDAPFCVNVLTEPEVQCLNIPIIEDPSVSVPGLSTLNLGPRQSLFDIRGVSSRRIARDQPATAGQSGCERLDGQCGRGPPVGRRSCLAAIQLARNHRDRAVDARAAFRFR